MVNGRISPHMPDHDELTPRQVRAARHVVNWTQGDLAEAADIDRRVLIRLENGQLKHGARQSTFQKIRAVLEGLGVNFIPSDGERFEGLRYVTADREVLVQFRVPEPESGDLVADRSRSPKAASKRARASEISASNSDE